MLIDVDFLFEIDCCYIETMAFGHRWPHGLEPTFFNLQLAALEDLGVRSFFLKIARWTLEHSLDKLYKQITEVIEEADSFCMEACGQKIFHPWALDYPETKAYFDKLMKLITPAMELIYKESHDEELPVG